MSDPDDSQDFVFDDDEAGIDNEETMEEADIIDELEDNDLDALRDEAEIPIEELRKRYYPQEYAAAASESSEALAGDGDATATESRPEGPFDDEGASGSLNASLNDSVDATYERASDNTNDLLEKYGHEGASSSDDADFEPAESHRDPRIGPDYQHDSFPTPDPEYKPLLDAEVLWKPSDTLSDTDIDNYLMQVLEYSKDIQASKMPLVEAEVPRTREDKPVPFWDNEDALYFLMQSGYDVERAAKRFSEGPADVNLPRKTHFGIMLPFTADDLNKFEAGLLTHGKDFHIIHKNFLPGRSIGEVIHFYYRWKKTERRDKLFARITDPMLDNLANQHALSENARTRDIIEQAARDTVRQYETSTLPANNPAAAAAVAQAKNSLQKPQ